MKCLLLVKQPFCRLSCYTSQAEGNGIRARLCYTLMEENAVAKTMACAQGLVAKHRRAMANTEVSVDVRKGI